MSSQTSSLPRPRFEAAQAPAALPDFCSVKVVFTVVVSAELLAFVLVLALPAHDTGRWMSLGLLSLYVQWIALSCTALLCLARGSLQRLGEAGAGLAAWLMIMTVTALLSALAYSVAAGAGFERLLSEQGRNEFLLRALTVAGILGAVVLRYFYVRAQNRRRLEAEARARFQALQARIRPHFMFNALNTIASLTRSRPAVAEEMVEDLAELLRESLAEAWRPSSLADELDLARRYLRMESLRLGERLRWQERCDRLPGDARVPALILQPLVENAVYHGIEPAPRGGAILIEGECNGGTVTLSISNPRADATARSRREGHHLALDNTRERLQLHFGGRARLDAAEDGDAFRVTLRFPYQRGES